MVAKQKKFTFRVTLIGLCLIISSVTALVAIGLQFYFSQKMAIGATQRFAEQAAKQVELSISKMDVSAKGVTALLATYPNLISDNQITDRVDKILSDILINNNDFYAIYYGLDNGDFYEIINLNTNDSVRGQLDAAHTDRFIRIHIYNQNNQRVKKTDYLNEYLAIRRTQIETSDYDATSRHWYKNATTQQVSKSKPYLFQHLQSTGQTYSKRVSGTNHVVAVDLTLETISDQLKSNFNVESSKLSAEMYIYNPEGELLLSNQHKKNTQRPAISPVDLPSEIKAIVDRSQVITISNELDWAPIDFNLSGKPLGFTPELIEMIGGKLGLEVNFINGVSWSELVDLYRSNKIDVLQPVNKVLSNTHLGVFSDPLLSLPFAITTQAHVPDIRSMKELDGKKVAIIEGWSIIPEIKSTYPEIMISEVPSLKDALVAVKNGEVDAAIDSDLISRYTAKMFFVDGIKFHSNLDVTSLPFDNQLRLVANDPDLITLFNYGLSLLTNDEKAYLINKWLNFNNQAELVASTTVPYEELLAYSDQPNSYNRVFVQTVKGIEYLIFISPTDLGPSEENYLAIMMPTSKAYEGGMTYVAKSVWVTLGILLLLMPLTWFIANPIVQAMRKLSIENQKIQERKYETLVIQSSFIKEIDDVFISLQHMADSIQEYERKQAQLLDSFVKIIAEAIDDKSPYTAGHCNRVPELGIMLADKASEDNSDYFADFKLDTDDKKREFKLGAWLHDCGKIITPEHIVDKGTKLECIYNRIHEIRMRFEVLLRDAEIEYLRNIQNNPKNEAIYKEQLEKQKVQLHDDFEFIALCNQGGEFMSEQQLNRLSKIAEQTWQRHFSDKLGLSPLEEIKVDTQSEILPIQEYLLMDKPTHLVSRDKQVEYAPHLGIKMTVPTYKANLGERYNLAIQRGTLTPEDRFIINEHMIGTIKMLDSLPFPNELSNVPRYASTHHETLKGTGYPRRLSAKDLSIPERILVLADIFEALTASDRPYKKAKSLSVAIEILYKMCLDEHVDIDVFRLFLTSGVYLDYAKIYLSESQIDEVDISKYCD